jgi:hypothetical protein
MHAQPCARATALLRRCACAWSWCSRTLHRGRRRWACRCVQRGQRRNLCYVCRFPCIRQCFTSHAPSCRRTHSTLLRRSGSVPRLWMRCGMPLVRLSSAVLQGVCGASCFLSDGVSMHRRQVVRPFLVQQTRHARSGVRRDRVVHDHWRVLLTHEPNCSQPCHAPLTLLRHLQTYRPSLRTRGPS